MLKVSNSFLQLYLARDYLLCVYRFKNYIYEPQPILEDKKIFCCTSAKCVG